MTSTGKKQLKKAEKSCFFSESQLVQPIRDRIKTAELFPPFPSRKEEKEEKKKEGNKEKKEKTLFREHLDKTLQTRIRVEGVGDE